MELALNLLEHWILVLMFAVLILSMAGIPNTGLGIQNMFHDDPALFQRILDRPDPGFAVYLNSPAIFVQCFITIFAVLGWCFVYTFGFIRADEVPPDVMTQMIPNVWPHIVVTSLISLFFGIVRVSDSVGPLQKWEWLRCLIGAAAGLLIGAAILVVARGVHPMLPVRADLAPTLAVAIPAGVIVVGLQLYKRLITGVAMVTLFSLILTVYALVILAPEAYHPLILIGILAAIIIFSNLGARLLGIEAPLKFEIPGIVDAKGQNHYTNMLDLTRFYPQDGQPPMEVMFNRAKKSARAAVAAEEHPQGDGIHRSDKIDPIIALEAWKNRVAKDGEKPKLVLVATSGGAYRASFWTAYVLDTLSALDSEKGSLPGLRSSIRLITGASGGMVGGAYYTAMVNPDGSPHPPLLQQMSKDIMASQEHDPDGRNGFPYQSRFPLMGDSLSPVVQQLVQRDIPRLFMAGVQRTDRGTVLEDQWLTLNKSFGEIRNEETMGLRPSIIFSPMLVETGQPLLITNLDMDEISYDYADETVEFFDWFPNSRDTFKLKTAVRLNAAFPYVAPSAALPTVPYRRVVDAGYYDNYGVDLAVSYLSQPKIRDWVIENTSGAMVIQIRAFPFAQPGQLQPGAVARGLQWLTTPVEGIGAARGSTMRFRNSQSFRRLQNVYRMKTDPHFLRSVVFEVDSDTSLSWYMPLREMTDMLANGANDLNRFAVQGIEAFWRGEKPPTDLQG
ncbi:MAG: hypothetical protein AAF415_19020 [Pseudomonadota bacterium]